MSSARPASLGGCCGRGRISPFGECCGRGRGRRVAIDRDLFTRLADPADSLARAADRPRVVDDREQDTRRACLDFERRLVGLDLKQRFARGATRSRSLLTEPIPFRATQVSSP
jgi:hypothetical protein